MISIYELVTYSLPRVMIKHVKNIPKPWWTVLDAIFRAPKTRATRLLFCTFGKHPAFRKETLQLEPQLPRELQAVQGLWQVKSGLRVRIDQDQAGAAGDLFPLPGEDLYTPFLAPCSCGCQTRSLYCQLWRQATPGPDMPDRMSGHMLERMPERRSRHLMSDRMPERMSKNVKIDVS